MSNTILKTDLKHCRLDLASQIIKDYEEDTRQYLNQNKDIYDDFCKVQAECSIEEYIFYYEWSDFIEYLRNKYNDSDQDGQQPKNRMSVL